LGILFFKRSSLRFSFRLVFGIGNDVTKIGASIDAFTALFTLGDKPAFNATKTRTRFYLDDIFAIAPEFVDQSM